MAIAANFPSIKPSLSLDFANVGRLDPRITFARASTATYFDQLGVLQSASNDVARFDHDPSTLAAQGLLIEEQRTNSIRNNTMQGAAAGTPGTLPTNWVVTAVGGLTTNVVGTGTTAGVTWIDVQITGTASATLYQLSFDGNTAIAATAGQAWTGSFWVALVGGSTTNITATNVRVSARDGAGATLATSDSAAITLTSSLTRYSTVYSSLPASTAYVQESLRLAITNGAAIDITLRIGLPQLEQGAFATSVIPTTTTALTRSADAASMTGTNFSSWFNASEGSLLAQYTRLTNATSSVSGGFPRVFEISDGTISNNIRVQGSPTALELFGVSVSGTGQCSISFNAVAVGSVSKLIGAYKQNDFAATYNGSAASTDTSGSVPTSLTTAYIGNRSDGNRALNGHIQRISFWPVRLANSQLQALTG